MSGKVTDQLRKSFVTGFVVTIPMFLTIIIVAWVVGRIDNNFWPAAWRPTLRGQPVPGLGLLSYFFIVLAVGFLTRNLFGRRLFRQGESLFRRVPLLGAIYGVLKQATRAVMQNKDREQMKPVIVEFPRKGVYALAFVTQPHAPAKARLHLGDDLVSVFVPTTPNPTSGYYVMMRKSELIDIDLSPQEAARLLLSAGIRADDGPDEDQSAGFQLDPSKPSTDEPS